MARYPTFEEYAKTGKHVEGVKRCNDLLKKSPKDSQLLIVKLQLLCAIEQDHAETLDQLLAIKPVITNLGELCTIEAAVIESLQDVYPPVITVGPSVNKLWDNAFKALLSPRDKLDLLTVRFNRAVVDNRLQDAQQNLIAIKVFQPKNRAMYMAHAAYTQLLSKSKEDLQSRLALSLARKAVAERYDDEKGLDCRVPGQIFAHQNSEKDLEDIRERSFRESKQVYHALKLSEPALSNGTSEPPQTVDPNNTSSRVWLLAEVEKLKQDFSKIINAGAPIEVLKPFIANAIRLFHTSITSLDLGGRDRGAADACFLAISGLVKLWSTINDTAFLLQASYLAERLLKHNGHIHEARLIMVYLSMNLGLGSLAMRYFDSLSIKEVQYDTVGHTLFSQISLMHPFKVHTAKSDFDPHERSQRGLSVYPRHDEKLADCESAVLDHGQTGMIFDLQELRSSLRNSLTRRTLVLEHRRIARLTGKARAKNASNVGPRKLANWTNVKDNRDFSAAFDFGFNVEQALYKASSQDTDTLKKLAVDTAWSLASKQEPLILDIDELVTQPSTTSNDLMIPLIKILHALSTSGTSPSASSIKTLIDSLKHLRTPESATTITTTYQTLDSLRIVLQSCRYIKDTATNIPMEVKELQDLARKMVKEMQTYAKNQLTSVKPGPIVERLKRDEFLAPFDKDESMQDFAEKLIMSAKEGWEGFGKIMIPGM